MLEVTKGELFRDRKNWQSARSAIQKIARDVFKEANPHPKCAICGYSNHVEVAHIKAVNEFDDSATIKEIDSIANLIGLCPNHHWEYDNGILEL
jgi:predicted restriction endonuclease